MEKQQALAQKPVPKQELEKQMAKPVNGTEPSSARLVSPTLLSPRGAPPTQGDMSAQNRFTIVSLGQMASLNTPAMYAA